jgi:AcrR family transcriptional regulator
MSVSSEFVSLDCWEACKGRQPLASFYKEDRSALVAQLYPRKNIGSLERFRREALGQPTFFRYFPTKDAVLREVGEREYACICERLRSEVSSKAHTSERLRRLYVTMAREVEADRQLWQLRRQVFLRSQHNLTACMVASKTDMLLTLPERHAQLLNTVLLNQVHPFPLQAPRLEAHLYWHESVENDPANRWLREEIEKVLSPESQEQGAVRKPGSNSTLDSGTSGGPVLRPNSRVVGHHALLLVSKEFFHAPRLLRFDQGHPRRLPHPFGILPTNGLWRN